MKSTNNAGKKIEYCKKIMLKEVPKKRKFKVKKQKIETDPNKEGVIKIVNELKE